MRRGHGRLLRSLRYESPDSDHGWIVEQAAWTPDSRFFVWSLESLGGHSPTRNPTCFWSRRMNRILSLGDLVGHTVTRSATGSLFKLYAPNTVAATIEVEVKVGKRAYVYAPTRRYSLARLEAAYARRRHLSRRPGTRRL
jgi:hypothetical protein